MNSNNIVSYEDLDDSFYVRLEKVTVQNIMKKLKKKYKTWANVAISLNTPATNIYRIRKRCTVNIKMLRSMLINASLSFDDVKKCIISLKVGDRGKEIPNILPIYPSPNLASTIANSFGDGGIHKKSCRFEYTNSNDKLIEIAKDNVKNVFNFDKPYQIEVPKTNTIVKKLLYPSALGKLLVFAGAPRGNKVCLKFLIPNWIMNGDKDIKKAFLTSLFDDEGSVEKRFLLSLSLSKKYQNEDNLFELFSQIKLLLEEFGIDNCNITLRKMEDGVKGVLRISNLLRIEKFRDEIGFNHTKRKERLENLLKTKRRVYRRNGETERVIINELKNGPLSTVEISQKIKRSRTNANRFLLDLERKKMVKRFEKRSYNIIWSVL